MSQFVLPELPPEWTTVSVGEIAQIVYGKALRAESRAGEGGIPVFASGGVVGEHNEALHPGPSVIVGRKGTVGAVYYVPGPFWCIDTAFYLDSINMAVNIKFLTYMLRRMDLSRLSIVVGVPGISRKDVESVQIPLPPLPEQCRIVKILTQAEALRQLRCQASEKAARLPQELFYEIFGRGITKTKDWPTKVGDITSFITSGSRGWARYYSDRGGKFIRVQNVLMDELDLSDMAYVQPPDSPDKRRTAVEPGDLLITITGSTGRVAVAPTDLGEAYVSQHVAIVRMDGSISPHYVSAYIAHPLGGQWQLERMSYGQIKPGLNLAQIQSLEILRPPDELIDEFLERQSVARKVLETQKRATDRLERQIESLLTQAFTGELTAAWRDAHRDELERAAAEMRERLGVVRERPPVEVEAVAPPAIIEPIPTDLSPTQEAALTAAWEQRSPFTLLSLGRHATLQSLSRTRLREAVEMLVALGYLVETYVQSQDGPLLCLRLATRDDLLPAEEMSL